MMDSMLQRGRGLKITSMASVGLLAICSPFAAMAQDAAAAPERSNADKPTTVAIGATPVADNGGLGDIVVTARRGAENLEHIPVSVQVVTGDQVQKLAITAASELSKLAPGLTLAGADNSAGTKVVLRGVTWQPGSGTPATPIYVNEIPFDPQNTLQSIFDIGQIEVLRGPQGTSRGAPSISGAVTITTRHPDLREIGGYVQGLYGEGGHRNIQGAINVPIIKDVLAIRASGFYEDSDADRIRSVNNSKDPSFRNRTERLSILFKPTDTLSFEAMYQRRRQTQSYYDQVVGTGSPGLAALGIPANFNGPALTRKDNKSVEDRANSLSNNVDLLSVNASWEVFGQRLSYNFGRQFDHSRGSAFSQDIANMLPGFETFLTQDEVKQPFFQTQEIHLASIRDEDRPFDYDIGWFSRHSHNVISVTDPFFLTGAFGAPGTLPGAVTTPNSRYVLQNDTNIASGDVFDSFYGSIKAYLDQNTELSGGLSIIRDRVPVRVDVTTQAAATVALPSSALGGLPCAGIPGVFVTGLVDSQYPGFCDAEIPAGVGNTSENDNNKYSAALYNFSLSHRFGSKLLVYGTTGTSFRTGLPAIANTGLPADLLVPKPEKATSYEVGVKSTFGRRLRINADVYQINYSNQLTAFAGIPYFNSVSGTTATTSIAFYRNIDARVRGAEVEIAAEPVDRLSLGLNFSYSKIKSKGGSVPCNDPSGPTLSAANPINFCQSAKGQVLNTQAPFQATANGSYDLPLGEVGRFGELDGYFRFNVNFQGKNPNYGNFAVDGGFTKTPSFAIVDMFAGITGNKEGWDLGIYAKNVFNKQVELTRTILLNTIYPAFAGASNGYSQITSSLPREIGVTLRYSFGSR